MNKIDRFCRSTCNMKLIVVFLGLVSASLTTGFLHSVYSKQEEFNEKKFHDMYARSSAPIDPKSLKKFEFPGYKGFPYKPCEEYKKFSDKHDYCPSKGYGWHDKDRCEDEKCNYWTLYGSTKCLKKVKLYKKYYYLGKECEYPGKECDKEDHHIGNRYSPYKPPKSHCECQTIWCLHQIYTVFEHYGKYLKGYVTVKVPCKCECRKKIKTYW